MCFYTSPISHKKKKKIIYTRSLLRKIIIVFDQTRGTYTTFIYCTVLQIYSKRAALSLSQQYLQKYLQNYSDNTLVGSLAILWNLWEL